MATTIYGSYDDLVIEVHGLDTLRVGKRKIRIPLAEIESVQALDEVGADVSVEVGPRSQPAVVIRSRNRGRHPSIAVHRRDAEELAADLVRRGVGCSVALV